MRDVTVPPKSALSRETRATASSTVAAAGQAGEVRTASAAEPAGEGEGEPHVSRVFELGLMAFSVIIALIGISLAWKFYVTSPQLSDQLAERWAGAPAMHPAWTGS